MTKIVQLGDEIELAYGKGLPQRSRIPGDFPVYGSNGQVDTHKEALVKGPGIIVGRKGSVGEVIWCDKDFWPIDTTYYVKLKNPNDNLKYWYYQLKMLGLNKLNSHSAIPGLNRDVAYAKEVVKRTPEEQKKIANILGTIDKKIELNRKMNKTLEQMGRALFRRYFIDNPDTEKWKRGILTDLIDLNPRESIAKDTEATYLEMKNMPEVGISVRATERRKFTSGMKFRNGDTLFARITPCLENGKTAFVDFLDGDEVGFGSTEYIVMRPRQVTLTEYTYFLARSNVFRAYAIQSMVGTSGRQRVQNDSIAAYEIAIPDVELLIQFHEKMEEFFAHIRSNTQQIQTLTALRDTLLPRLMNGEVRV